MDSGTNLETSIKPRALVEEQVGPLPSKADTVDERREVLIQLLRRNSQEFHIEYEKKLNCANHLMCGLVALYKLGVDSFTLREFFGRYTHMISLEKAIPSEKMIDKSNWKENLGKRLHYRDYCDFFMKEAERLGITPMIRFYFPLLAPGLCGSVFHGLLALGFAIESQVPETICEGLGFMAYVYRDMGTLSTETANKPFSPSLDLLRSTLDKVKEDSNFTSDMFKEMNFQERMDLLLSKKYAKYLEKYDLPLGFLEVGAVSETASNITHCAASLLAYCKKENDFFLLHLVTSSRALKMGILRLDNLNMQEEIFRYFWRGIICVYICQVGNAENSQKKQGKQTIEVSTKVNNGSTVPEWKTIVKRAVSSLDAHLIKLAYVCSRAEESWKGDDSLMYRWVCWKFPCDLHEYQ